MSDSNGEMVASEFSGEPVVDIISGKKYYRTELVCCPLCGQRHKSRQLNVRFGMKVMVAECKSCRLAYQTPRPSTEACRAYMDMRWNSSDAYVKDAKSQRRNANKQMQYVNKLHRGPGSLLDFGAGIGTFVRAAMEQGWHAVGVERSASAIDRAKEENGVELRLELPDGEYDIITLWDVVEHLHRPEETFLSLKKLLRPGGYVIMETVNWESWLRLALGDKWNLYLFDHHFYFSPASLEQLLVRCGLHNFRLLSSKPTPPIFRMFLHIGLNRLTWAGYHRAKALWPEHYRYNVITAAVQAPDGK